MVLDAPDGIEDEGFRHLRQANLIAPDVTVGQLVVRVLKNRSVSYVHNILLTVMSKGLVHLPQKSFLAEKVSLDNKRKSRLYAFRRKIFISVIIGAKSGKFSGIIPVGGRQRRPPLWTDHGEERDLLKGARDEKTVVHPERDQRCHLSLERR